ncbi:MAG: DUF1178 family protein [Pseudomonadota bacterium]
MIRFNLRCADGHGFESWFGSGEDYQTLCDRGLVTCPECGSAEVEKALMAPKVSPARKAVAVAKSKADEIAKIKAHVEANSDYVGSNFVSEARAMHEGVSEERSIYGEAKLEDAAKLIKDGVPVAPLPFIPKQKAN